MSASSKPPDCAALRNLGPTSRAWLAAVGITTREQIVELGVLAVMRRLWQAGFKPTFNMAYALAGAMLDCDWRQLPLEEKRRLVLEVDALKAEIQAEVRAAGRSA